MATVRIDNRVPQFDIIDYVSLDSLLNKILLQISDNDLSTILRQENEIEQMLHRLIEKHDFMRDYSKEITEMSKHFEYEPQTPTCNSWICVITAHTYLIPAVVLGCCKLPQYNVLSGILCILYVTSIWHWYQPRFKGWARSVDIFMAMSSVLYCSYCATMLPGYYSFVWYACVLVTGICFFANRLLYHYQVGVAKNVMIENFHDSMFKSLKSKQREAELGTKFSFLEMFRETFSLEITWPNTIRRDYAQYRAVFFHAIGVHLVTAFGGFVLSCVGYTLGL